MRIDTMKHLQLNNNDDLYRYLVSLADELRKHDKTEASGRLTLASQFAFGSASEFLDEALAALTSVHSECKDALTEVEWADLESVIQQIRIAFQRIGGA
jgi:hypothetical protein